MDLQQKILANELKLVALGKVLNESAAELEQMKKQAASTPVIRRNLKKQRLESIEMFYTKRAISKQLKKQAI